MGGGLELRECVVVCEREGRGRGLRAAGCQADKSAVSGGGEDQGAEECVHGVYAKRDSLSRQFWKPSLPCERLSPFQRVSLTQRRGVQPVALWRRLLSFRRG